MRLTDAVNRLADELRVVRDVLDDVREDLNWVTRNGISGRVIQHTRVVRMARDPLAPDAASHLELRTYTLEPKNTAGISPEVFDELVSEIAEAMTVVGQEQLNMFLTALDDARARLMAAIKHPAATSAKDTPVVEPSDAEPRLDDAHLSQPQAAKDRRRNDWRCDGGRSRSFHGDRASEVKHFRLDPRRPSSVVRLCIRAVSSP